METVSHQHSSAHLKEALDFCNRVHSRIFKHHRHNFASFATTLLSLPNCHNPLHDVDALVSLFHGHPDLLQTFRAFFPNSDSDRLFSADHDHQRHYFTRSANQARYFLRKVSRRLDKARFSAFLSVFTTYRDRDSDRNEARKEVASYIGEFSNLMDAYDRFWDYAHKVQASLSWLRDCDCGPSYRRRPCKRPKLEVQDQVLNDDWVCEAAVSNGNENYGTQQERFISRQEELQNKVEDELYDVEMTLVCFRKSAERIESLIASDIDLKLPIKVKDHFSASNLGCIEKLYGDQSSIVIETLGKTPGRVLPILLKRLREKEESLTSHLRLRNVVAYRMRQKQIHINS